MFGATGFVATNMAMLLLSVWLGALYLRQYNSDALALLFSAGFFLASNAFALEGGVAAEGQWGAIPWNNFWPPCSAHQSTDSYL